MQLVLFRTTFSKNLSKQKLTTDVVASKIKRSQSSFDDLEARLDAVVAAFLLLLSF
jgi:hypothetical protein